VHTNVGRRFSGIDCTERLEFTDVSVNSGVANREDGLALNAEGNCEAYRIVGNPSTV
jgi:hypothetical protein